MQLWLNNARKIYQNDQVPYHPRSTMMCLGWNEIGVPRLSVTTAEAGAAGSYGTGVGYGFFFVVCMIRLEES